LIAVQYIKSTHLIFGVWLIRPAALSNEVISLTVFKKMITCLIGDIIAMAAAGFWHTACLHIRLLMRISLMAGQVALMIIGD
jgi:hypothetical protein